ncbi:EAL domain-containing protein [Rhodopseudomonas sp. BR0M22]|uniref:putative bifunctional diguanylate cyclase/phosphodiesterase n=1 Tax=Rhodopseudomonas sp. BR0M22 TaxID=2269369 RepID=UPI0013E0733A|nr:EAL domain-containing protein [Rhodopseudomonas sp. BR0M22]NEW92117.1 EAL domain-containing protein [Rhodopseudomonas sp. BR0M22]
MRRIGWDAGAEGLLHGPRNVSVRGIVVSGVLLGAAIAMVTGWMVMDSRERVLRNTERELRNTALLLSRQFDRSFEALNIDQSETAASLENTFPLAKSRTSHTLLSLKAAELGEFDLFGSDGALINTSRSWPVPPVQIGTDHNFQRWISDDERDEKQVEFVRDPVLGGWTLALVKRLRGPTKQTSGILTRTIPTAWHETLASSLALGSDATIAVFTSGGALVTRWPRFASSIGENYLNSDLKPLFSRVSTSRRIISPFDGSERIAAARALSKQPIVVVVSRSVDGALAAWWHELRTILSIALATGLAVAVVLFQLGRNIIRHQTDLRQRYSIAVDNMTQGLSLFDAEGRLLLHNRRYLEIYRLPADAVKPGLTGADLIALMVQAGHDPQLISRYSYLANNHRDTGRKFEVELADGRTILVINEPIQGGGWVTTHEEVTERKRADSRIHHLAHFDELTGLPNRSSFRDHLGEALDVLEPGDRLALIYIDIDEFKIVNDTLGHPVGDQLLRSIAERLQGCVGANDYVARLGGDEFAVVTTDAGAVRELVSKLQRTLRDSFDCADDEVSLDASIGIALAPEHGAELDELIAKADLALYAAKSEGRHTYRFFIPDMDVKAKARHELATELKRAVAERDFQLHFQPLVDLNSGTVAGCEALLRWKHPVRGFVSPAEFIPLAEDIGLIEELGEWVLDQACAIAVGWPATMTVAVNVSPIQFRRSTFPLKVAATLARTGLSADRLELEITEALLLQDTESTLAVLNQLRALGVKIALDDFGTGYSSLSYLHRFPIDKIKIDKSFVDTLTEEAGSAMIIRAIAKIAAAGHKTTLAEGVETAEQRELLRKLGCQQMQGYLFSPAIPSDALTRLIAGTETQTGIRRAPATA